METQIKKYMPSDKELEGLDLLISNIPELQDIIENSSHSLDLIIRGIDTLNMPLDYKKGLKQLFVALQKTHTTSEVYKYSNFRNQDTILKLLDKEKQYISIIKGQANKHNDNYGVDEMNKMFSSIDIKPKKDTKVSPWTVRTIKDIKFQDDFKPIFSEIGVKTYKQEELLDMKSSKKGPKFNNVDKIIVNNTPNEVIVTNKKY